MNYVQQLKEKLEFQKTFLEMAIEDAENLVFEMASKNDPLEPLARKLLSTLKVQQTELK